MGEETAMWRELLPAIITGIVGIVVLVVGAVTSSVTSGIGVYILGTFNNSGIKIPGNYNFLQSLTPILPTVFTLLGVSLLVVAAIIAIVFLFKTIGVMKREAQV
jgi:hypothetical protein